jgi:gluconate 5-dehydrogenase
VIELFSLDGKVALITGASRGLGRAMALALAGCGAHVVVNGRNQAGIEATQATIISAGSTATAMPFDTTDASAADAAIDRIEAELGHLDILVNNAGYGNAKAASEATNAEWNEIIEVDLNACFRLARRASREQRLGLLHQARPDRRRRDERENLTVHRRLSGWCAYDRDF